MKNAPAPIRALVIDDEPPARERIAELLALHEGIVQEGEAEDVETALELCNSLKPDALFLDIEMGKANGFSLLERLPPPLPGIVFVTAHEDFSLRAFAVDAVDYLLKPIGPARFEQAIRKLERFCNSRCEELVVQGSGGPVILTPETITHIEADGNYTQVYCQGGTPLHVRRGIVQWMDLLPSGRFVRVHRSLIVNRKLVRNIRSLDRELGELFLDGAPAPVTLKRRALLRLRHLFG